MARARPRTAWASSRSPRASMRGSVLRTRALPKSEVSPRSPVRVVTRADARRRAVIAGRIRAAWAMLDAPCELPAGFTGGTDADGSRRGEGQEGQEKVQRTAREGAAQEVV